MKWIVILAVLGLLVFVLVFVVPPFVLPAPVYDVLYGWRYPKSWECGSSVITDFGPREARHRFVVDVGSVDLSAEGVNHFTLCRIPLEVSYMALAVSWDEKPIHIGGPVGWRNYEKIAKTQVSITVHDSQNREVTSYSGRLGKDWTWSGPNGFFLNEVWIYGNGTRIQLTPTETYSVELIVNDPSQFNPNVRLVAAGGGWK